MTICIHTPVKSPMEHSLMRHFYRYFMNLTAKMNGIEPNAWKKANPGLNTIKKLSDLSEKVHRAKNNPKDLSGILTKDFNIRDTISTAWLSFDDINNEKIFDLSDFKKLLCHRRSRFEYHNGFNLCNTFDDE